MTDAEIAGHMNWRGPGAYTHHAMKRIKKIIAEVQAREREACAKVCEEEICNCCWDEDAQAAAEHLAEAIRESSTT